MNKLNFVEKLPYREYRPDTGGKVRAIIEMFAMTLVNPHIKAVYELCDRECPTCYRGGEPVITPHFRIIFSTYVWYGCLLCGTQTNVDYDTRDELDSLLQMSPSSQRDFVEERKTPMRYKLRQKRSEKPVDKRPPRIIKREKLENERWKNEMRKKYRT